MILLDIMMILGIVMYIKNFPIARTYSQPCYFYIKCWGLTFHLGSLSFIKSQRIVGELSMRIVFINELLIVKSLLALNEECTYARILGNILINIRFWMNDVLTCKIFKSIIEVFIISTAMMYLPMRVFYGNLKH